MNQTETQQPAPVVIIQIHQELKIHGEKFLNDNDDSGLHQLFKAEKNPLKDKAEGYSIQPINKKIIPQHLSMVEDCELLVG